MDLTKTLTLAIDFDGTIVEDAYPKIGKPNPFAFETLKKTTTRWASLDTLDLSLWKNITRSR